MQSQPTPDVPWGTYWELTWAVDPRVADSNALVTLGFQDGRAGGKAPVNRFFGLCSQSPEGLRLGPFGSTMMAGPPEAMTAESVFLGLLDRVSGLRLAGEELVLVDSGSDDLLRFRPAAPPA